MGEINLHLPADLSISFEGEAHAASLTSLRQYLISSSMSLTIGATKNIVLKRFGYPFGVNHVDQGIRMFTSALNFWVNSSENLDGASTI